jgi:hypothetical protein
LLHTIESSPISCVPQSTIKPANIADECVSRMAQTTTAVPTGPIADNTTNSNKLEDLAATAALYVKKIDTNKNGQEYLDDDNRLSSAGRYNGL